MLIICILKSIYMSMNRSNRAFLIDGLFLMIINYRFKIESVFTLSNATENMLVGRAESIHPQRKWCNGFSHYTTGRVGDFPFFGKASTEVRDRTVARTVPRSR